MLIVPPAGDQFGAALIVIDKVTYCPRARAISSLSSGYSKYGLATPVDPELRTT
jgi:hypothetical protein